MAVAASLNVNLTATSGAYTSTMTKAGSTLERLGKTATSINRGFKSVVAFTGLKKGINFVTSAIGDIDKLKVSAAKAGFAFSEMDTATLSRVQMIAEKAGGAFDAMKLQLLIGLAPAITFVTDLFERMATITIDGFSAMEIAGKSVGATVIVIGKAFQAVYSVIQTGLLGLQVILKGIVDLGAKAFGAIGQTAKANELKAYSAVLEKAIDMQAADIAIDWEKILSWPEAQKAGARAGGAAAAAMKSAITAPQAISAGSQASALFDFRKREAAIRAKQDPKQKADEKQVALLGRIDRGIARLIQLQGETTVVNA